MIDLIILIFVAVFVFLGYKKGLVNSIVSMCSYLLSIVATYLLYKPFHSFLAGSSLGKSITEKINTYLIEKFSDTILAEINIPSILKAGVEENADALLNNSASYAIAQNITNALFMIISFVVLYFAIKILLKLLRTPLNIITSIPIIKEANTLLGAAIGLAMGFLWLYVIASVIGTFSFMEFLKPISDAIKNSNVMNFLYENNFLLSLIKF